jgi:hypothetical protein
MTLGELIDWMNESFEVKNISSDISLNCIVEGGYQEDFHRVYTQDVIYDIPEETNVISLSGYDLRQIAYINEDKFDLVEVSPESEFKLGLRFPYEIQRLRTLATEDGRIYFDTTLSDHFLFDFLNMLKHRNGSDYLANFEF